MIRKNVVPALAALLLAAGTACDSLESPNFNAGDLNELQDNPTAAGVLTAAQGLMIGTRAYNVDDNDLVSMLGIVGRESYNLDVADPRFESEMLGGDLQPGSPAFGGNLWDRPYANIRLADIVLNGVAQLEEAEMSQEDRDWIQGFTKTIMALDFLTIVNTRDTNCGCPIEVPEGADDPAPAVGKAEVFSHIASLLDEARGHLQATSGGPPFDLSSGFADFSTAEAFLTLNRAIRARAAVYTMDFATALQALDASFLDPDGDLDLGAYHAFSNQSGDVTNGLFQPSGDPNLRAHPSLKQDVELKPGGTPDDRFVRKTREIDSRAYQGLCTEQSQFPICDVGFDIYTSTTASVPIIRNEELILLRAEANIGLGNLQAAEEDINRIRDRSGGLPPVELTSAEGALDQLLYEKRLSLLFEGGHRWIDLRRYGLLGRLPLDKPGHQVNAVFPVPLDETLAN